MKSCILFSGGADSTFILCQYAQNKEPIDVFIMDRYNKPIAHAYRVIELINNFFHTEYSIHILNVQNVGEAVSFLSLSFDEVLFGGNQYPSDKTIRPKFKENTITQEWLDSNPKIVAPLMSMNKSDIVRSFYERGWEDILKATHSCGSDKEEPCGECFNCRERAWAFKQLNLPVDLGL